MSGYASLDNEPLERSNTLFSSRKSNYVCLAKETRGQNNLEEDIEDESFQNNSIHNSIRIRRRANGALFPYSTNMLYEWIVTYGNSTEPMTREDISYVRKRLCAKKKWMELFPDITVQDLTPEFRNEAFQGWLELRRAFPTNNTGLHKRIFQKARAFVDLASLEVAGVLVQTTCADAEMILRSLREQDHQSHWLFRKSDKHGQGISGSQIFTVSFITAEGLTSHRRFIQIDGAGIFKAAPLQDSFEAYLALGVSHICVIDVLQEFIRKGYLIDMLHIV